jgi:hypothetical protein
MSMNTEVEDLLREGMERFTTDLRAPAGLVRRAAARRRRRRRLALGSVTGAVATLAAGATALAMVVLPGVAGPAVADAAVVQRVSSALSAAEPGDIAQMTVTTSFTPLNGKTQTTTAREWSYDGRWRSVVNSPAGHPVYDEGTNSSGAYTVVSYQTRTWARARQQEPGNRPKQFPAKTNGCGPAAGGIPFPFRFGLPGIGLPDSSLPETVATAVRTAISCGTLSVTGRQEINGIDTIKLMTHAQSPFAETIWVSPGTYLPVRIVVRSGAIFSGSVSSSGPASATGPGGPVVEQTANITWLPPTTGNLANLTVPIPAGFREVSLAAAAAPIITKTPGGLLPRGISATCFGLDDQKCVRAGEVPRPAAGGLFHSLPKVEHSRLPLPPGRPSAAAWPPPVPVRVAPGRRAAEP